MRSMRMKLICCKRKKWKRKPSAVYWIWFRIKLRAHTALRICNFIVTWRWVVILTLRPLHYLRKSLEYYADWIGKCWTPESASKLWPHQNCNTSPIRWPIITERDINLRVYLLY
jgi:hypothetical protein